jgi:hypothetical protein
LLRAWVDDWDDPIYVHPDHADLLAQAAEGALAPTLTTILSPFDPVVWDRRRAQELFNFDYRLECYTPAESASTATSRCRSCGAARWSAASTPRRTAARVSSK